MLTSSCCLVTGRMEVKVANFGVERIRSSSRVKKYPSDVEIKYRSLWEAPELLSNPNLKDDRSRQKCDIYSFAIISHEIMFEQGPYWMGQYTESAQLDSGKLERLLDNIKFNVRDITGKSTRPHLPSSNEQWCKLCNINTSSSTAYRESVKSLKLIIQCWDQEPKSRPSFDQMVALSRNMKTDLIEDLQRRLQEYTDKLEHLVDKKTVHLQAEKEKADKLVNMLIPTPVADELKTGVGSKPTEYEHTTIFQSDIHGFTSIGKRSTPLQIMEMLGDIYIVFDKLLSQHDAYKVVL